MSELAKEAAARMNERVLAEGEEGGEWSASTAQHDPCEACGRTMEYPEPCVVADAGGGLIHCCLPCVANQIAPKKLDETGALALRELEQMVETMKPGPNRVYWQSLLDDVRALAAKVAS